MRLFKASALFVCLFLALPFPSLATAQTPAAQAPARDGKLVITVADQLGAMLPTATVVVTGLDDANKGITVAPVKANEKGVATIEGLLPGRYSVKAQFPGLDDGIVKETRVRAGENRVNVSLFLKKMEDSVTVSRDKQEVGSDRALSFGSALTREQIEALADDPDDMARQLREMAGPDAIMRVDSFEGQQLPPKAQIKAIRISRDQFAAENHGTSSFIDIVTQAGIGPIRTNLRTGLYNAALDGRNPLVPAKGPGQNRNFGGGISGVLIPNKLDINLNVNGTNSYSTPQLYASNAEGETVARNLNLRAPSNSFGVSANLNYALTKDQTMRIGVNTNVGKRDNLLGGQDYAERAYSTDNRTTSIRISEIGPLGRRFFTSTRFSLNWSDVESESVTEARAIVVPDAFTRGGAQRSGGTHSRAFIFQSDLDYVRGKHSFRFGLQMDGGFYRTDASTNYLGTYMFESTEAFNEGRPRSYTQRIGNPTVDYWNVQTAFFIQDDYRPKKNLSVSYGLRYEVQTHAPDRLNFAPRIGVTWSPFKSGKTTLRTSAGIFYDWFSMGTYSQVLQTDGTRQREVNISDPSFPDPGVINPADLPTNRYLLDSNMLLPKTNRFSLGASQSLTNRLNIGGSYSYNRVSNLLVGENLNTPVNGIRPLPEFANLIRAMSLARSRVHSLSVNANLSLSRLNAGPQTAAGQKFFDWRRGLYVSLYPSLNFADNNTDGAFQVPASGDLSQEWGAVGSRGYIQVGASSGMVKNLNLSFNYYRQGPSALTVRTGYDDNGDLIFNDRPAGLGRGTERAPGTDSSSMYLSYNFGLGRATASVPQGIMITSSGVGLSAAQLPMTTAPRYRINLSVSIDNPLNRANLVGYSGVETSPFFLKPTAAQGVRRFTFNAGLNF